MDTIAQGMAVAGAAEEMSRAGADLGAEEVENVGELLSITAVRLLSPFRIGKLETALTHYAKIGLAIAVAKIRQIPATAGKDLGLAYLCTQSAFPQGTNNR